MSKYIQAKDVITIGKAEVIAAPLLFFIPGSFYFFSLSAIGSPFWFAISGFVIGAVPVIKMCKEFFKNPFTIKRRLLRTAVAEAALKKDLEEIYGIKVDSHGNLITLLQGDEIKIDSSSDKNTEVFISLDPQTSVPIVAKSVTVPTITTIEHAKPVTHAITSGNTLESSADKREPTKVLPASLFNS